VSGRDFALSDKRGTWQNVAAGFSLRLHRLKACATKQFPDEDGIHQDTKDIMSRHVGWARPTKKPSIIFKGAQAELGNE
jgi:hypothetical protein